MFKNVYQGLSLISLLGAIASGGIVWRLFWRRAHLCENFKVQFMHGRELSSLWRKTPMMIISTFSSKHQLIVTIIAILIIIIEQ